MEVPVLNIQGEKVQTVELAAAVFEVEPNMSLMHQAYVRQMANARLGTHSTKGRSEVAGGGRKPWNQKGTGRARQGSIRSAQWVGGGKIHTPKPRDYTQKMPKKMRRAALRSALSIKAAEEQIIVLDGLHLIEPKTKNMKEVLNRLTGDQSTLVLMPRKDANYELVARSINNLTSTKSLLADYINIRDLLAYDKIIMPLESVDVITSHLS